MVKVYVGKESGRETRVATTPESVKKMVAAGIEVSVQSGAGVKSQFSDAQYEAVGSEVVADASAAMANADVVLRVAAPSVAELEGIRADALVVGLLAPHQNVELVEWLVERRVSSIAMELIPRITRAQEMDVLSSQASIAGYKAVLLAASKLGKYFPLMMTAAGTIPPAKVVVMGAGVAGLQAVATAKRLGAIVEVSDIRDVVKEQVESLGGRFIDLPDMGSGEGEGGYAREMGEEFLRRQREITSRHVAAADVVICTALIPGKKAPTLLDQEMVDGMKAGAVVVDLAVEQGGNCVLSEPEQEVVHNGVMILGPTNLPAETAYDASQLYSRNVWALVRSLLDDGKLGLDLEDEIVDGALLTHDGEVRHAPTRERMQGEGA